MISLKSEKEIEIMAEGGKILAEIVEKLGKEIRPGITTKELNRLAESLILNSGARPSFLGYQGFPAALCTSLNEEIVHCLPSDRLLKEGDIISLDLGILFKGFHTDMAKTWPVGEVSAEAKKIIEVTKKALEIGIEKAKPGNTFGDIGSAIQKYVESRGFNVVRELCGHGIGRELHQDPQILNYGKEGTGQEIKEGMVFCIEPMVTAGGWQLKKSRDGHCYQTTDGSLSCHFEHTLAAAKEGCRILTLY